MTAPREAVERMATTVLTINAAAKHPGTVGPENAAAYSGALRDGVAAFGERDDAQLPIAGHLLAVLFDLAEFAAARHGEGTAELVRAFAQHLEAMRSS